MSGARNEKNASNQEKEIIVYSHYDLKFKVFSMLISRCIVDGS
jgi:hypothetical protein